MENRKPKKTEGLIFGIHPVLEALEADRQLDKVFVRKGISPEVRDAIYEKAREAGVAVQTVPDVKLDRLCKGGNHQGVAALAAVIGYIPLEDLLISVTDSDEPAALLMLDGVTDVHNFGAIARSAECLGFQGIVVPEQGSARVNADAMKISAGALNHIPVARVRVLADAVMLMQAYGVRVIACSEKASESMNECDMKESLCLVMGAEDSGIDNRILKIADQHVSIPMKGKIGSLNVSVAAGILMMECLRQRGL